MGFFDVTIGDGGTGLETLIAQALSSNPVVAVKALSNAKQIFEKAKVAGLRITAAKLRKYMQEAFTQNTLNWKPAAEAKWFGGRAGTVPVGGLTAANKPIKKTTSSGKTKKRGYSQRAIKPPKARFLGGNLWRSIRYKIVANTMTVGALDAPKSASKLEFFQDGGVRQLGKWPFGSTQKYLAALGIYTKDNTMFSRPKRPLVKPIQERYPPDKLFQESFIRALEERIK